MTPFFVAVIWSICTRSPTSIWQKEQKTCAKNSNEFIYRFELSLWSTSLFLQKKFRTGDCKLAFYSRSSKDVVRRVEKINLDEYAYVTVQALGDSCPLRTTPVTPRSKTGYKTVRIYNCYHEKRPLDVWIRSKKEGQTVKSKYKLVAHIPHLWNKGSCPTGNHWTYSLSDGIIR